MSTSDLKQTVTTCLTLGVRLDEFDFRVFLRGYHRELRAKFPKEDGFPAYSPAIVLDSLMPTLEEGCDEAGGRLETLRGFCRDEHRLHLSLSGSDYGALERRGSPYSFDRATYHIGREIAVASLSTDYPGHNPYRSTRTLRIGFLRDHMAEIIEFLPDYLWWSIHDKQDMLHNMLAPESLGEVRRQIERSGYKLETFGLYLTNFEVVHPAKK